MCPYRYSFSMRIATGPWFRPVISVRSRHHAVRVSRNRSRRHFSFTSCSVDPQSPQRRLDQCDWWLSFLNPTYTRVPVPKKTRVTRAPPSGGLLIWSHIILNNGRFLGLPQVVCSHLELHGSRYLPRQNSEIGDGIDVNTTGSLPPMCLEGLLQRQHC